MSCLLCVEPKRDTWLRAMVERSVHFLLGEVSSAALEAVILTGSAARGEASVLHTPTGFRLLGDLEFLVIARAPIDWPALRRRMVEVSRRATRDLGDEGRSASIEYGPAGLVYLQQHIRPSIFAYDLQAHGQIVWGRPDILTEIRPFDAADIPREDALNLIMNRLIELAMVDTPACQAGFSTERDRPYQLAKVILDLPGSALAFAGHYISRYSERGHGFWALLKARPDLCQAFPDVGSLPHCPGTGHCLQTRAYAGTVGITGPECLSKPVHGVDTGVMALGGPVPARPVHGKLWRCSGSVYLT